jgi:hypothetical protein
MSAVYLTAVLFNVVANALFGWGCRGGRYTEVLSDSVWRSDWQYTVLYKAGGIRVRCRLSVFMARASF